MSASGPRPGELLLVPGEQPGTVHREDAHGVAVPVVGGHERAGSGIAVDEPDLVGAVSRPGELQHLAVLVGPEVRDRGGSGRCGHDRVGDGGGLCDGVAPVFASVVHLVGVVESPCAVADRVHAGDVRAARRVGEETVFDHQFRVACPFDIGDGPDSDHHVSG